MEGRNKSLRLRGRAERQGLQAPSTAHWDSRTNPDLFLCLWENKLQFRCSGLMEFLDKSPQRLELLSLKENPVLNGKILEQFWEWNPAIKTTSRNRIPLDNSGHRGSNCGSERWDYGTQPWSTPPENQNIHAQGVGQAPPLPWCSVSGVPAETQPYTKLIMEPRLAPHWEPRMWTDASENVSWSNMFLALHHYSVNSFPACVNPPVYPRGQESG